jgi:acetyl-CoA carboxylase biotin carboxyl carrier protein
MALVDVKTEITGIIQMIIRSVGDSVDEDEPVIMLESMKMQIPIAAPESGKVAEILVEQGDTVTEGSVVARIEA